MEKDYRSIFPKLENDQRDFNQSLISMLNCRRYLASLDFKEIRKQGNSYDDINCIAGGHAKIFFPNGSEVSNNDFVESNNRNQLIEMMIDKRAIIIPFEKYYNLNERSRVIRTTFGDDSYQFFLHLRDTTREKAGFFRRMLDLKPEYFANQFYMILKKEIITGEDIEEFERYKKGLEEAITHDTLLDYKDQFPQRKRNKPTQAEVPNLPSEFIDPWSVDIRGKEGEKN